jgi:hypothetical protein
MPGQTKCLSLVKGRRIRVTKLDGCGRPIFGECSQAVSKGFISVAFTANTLDTDEINVTNAAGERCVYEPAETSLTGYTLEIQFCEVDPELFALVTGQPVTYDASGDNGNGFDSDAQTSLTAGGVALELWAGAANTDACATEGSQGAFGYLLVPFLKGGIVGDFTVENGAVTFTLTGASTRDGNAWGVGPSTDIMLDDSVTPVPGPMTSPVSATTALRTMIVDVAPPTALCGCRPLMDPSVEPLVSISGVATGMTVAFTPDPEDIAASVWYDFGDGTWDYLAPGALGATSHPYDAPGTYTVRATSNGTWVETTVTVSA